jgi:TPR repeat protein
VDGRVILPKNTILDGSYRIEDVIGSGGFGVTYLAEDINLGNKFALKEYYPFDFGDRDSRMSVKPKSERHKDTFEWGRASFLQEARMLARFRHPGIVRVTRVFEANSTAYMVMEFEEGKTFENWLKAIGRPPPQEELDRIAASILDALELMHSANFLHRDIAPDNILIRADGSPVLLDFGAARRAVGEMSRSLTGIVKAGYSPQEQYATDGRLQGPWSDLYALGATLYRAVAGQAPEEATLRISDDRTQSAVQAAKGSYRPSFLASIDACLRPKFADRPQSVAQLRPMLLNQVEAESERLARGGATRRIEPTRGYKAQKRKWIVAAALVAVMGGSYAGFEYTRWGAEQRRKLEMEAKRQHEERLAAERNATKEQAAREAEVNRRADVAEAKRKAQEEVRAEAEARRQREERSAAEKKAAEERAAREVEAKRQADAAARKNAEEAKARAQAEAKRLQEERVAAERKTAEARATREAEIMRKGEEERRQLAEAESRRKADEERRSVEEARTLVNAKNYTRAAELLQPLADSGNTDAMIYLADLNLYGWGVPRDDVKAREWYEKAASRGQVGANVGLGVLYEHGRGVAKDFTKARELYEQAAALGNSTAVNNLGWLYYFGRGVTQSFEKARDHFERAAARGNRWAMNGLGVLHRDGSGVPRDYAKAREWFEKAGAAGASYGWSNLAWMDLQGQGKPKNFARAKELFEKLWSTTLVER